MNRIVNNLIIRPFILLVVLIIGLIIAGLIHDMNLEGTHFTRAVTSSKDAKLIKSDYWGFMDPTTRFHFFTTPKAIDDIIKDKGLKLVKNEEIRVYGLPNNEEWALHPEKISSYRYNRYVKYKNESHLGEEFLATTYILQHNQQKDEAFYFIDSY